MNAHQFTLMFAVLIGLMAGARGAPGGGRATVLSEAVAAFNEKSLADPIGAQQPPLTVDEVVAAVLLWERDAGSPVSDELLARFKRVAETRAIPDNACFESLTGYDRGGSHIFDVWSVRVRMEREDGSSYAFLIRERAVGSRTLSEELDRLNALIEDEGVEKWVGGYRILGRKKELEARIGQGGR